MNDKREGLPPKNGRKGLMLLATVIALATFASGFYTGLRTKFREEGAALQRLQAIEEWEQGHGRSESDQWSKLVAIESRLSALDGAVKANSDALQRMIEDLQSDLRELRTGASHVHPSAFKHPPEPEREGKR